jgi:hypothetical protein
MGRNGKHGKLIWLVIFTFVIASLGIAGWASVSTTAADEAAIINMLPVAESTAGLPREGKDVTPDSALSLILVLPEEVLSGAVYVLADGRVVTEIPLLVDASAITDSIGDNMVMPSAAATIAAQFTVIPTRIVVVGDGDEIIGIWNNTSPEDTFYCLRVKWQDAFGPQYALTPQILDRYNDLLNKIDWSETGKVFPGKR